MQRLTRELKQGGRPLIIIAGAALLLRWLHLLFAGGSDLIRLPIIDAAFYDEWAKAISHGQFGHGTFFMSPLYPYLMGIAYAIFGAAPLAVMLIQGLLGTATVVLLYVWAARLTDRRTALVAAALAALYAPFIFYDGTLLTSSLILLLSAGILLLSEEALESAGKRGLIALGILLGLSVLARPLAFLFLPFLFVALFKTSRATAMRRFGWVILGLCLTLFPVTLRNLIFGGEFAITTSSAGMNFYVGNNPDANGLYWEAPFLSSAEPQFESEDYRRAASEALERDVNNGEAGRYWMMRSLDWMLNHPLDYLGLLARKAFYFWNRAEFANNVSIYVAREVSPIIRFDPIAFWLVAPLGFAGLIRMRLRLGSARLRIAWYWLWAYFAGALAFFVASEYRLPALLPLLLGCAALMVEIYDQLKARQYDPALKAVALGLLFLPLTNFRTGFTHGGENARMDWFNFGNTLMKFGEDSLAVSRFEHSLKIDPHYPEALLRLAEAHYRTGDVEAALAIGKQAGLEKPETILQMIQNSALQEAYSLLDEGQTGGAMKEFTVAGWKAEQAAAETTRVNLLNRARAAYETQRFDESLQLFEDVARADTAPDPMVLHNIAFIHLQSGRIDSAEAAINLALAVDSMSAPSIMLAARIYNTSGKHEEAERIMHRLGSDSEGREAMLQGVRGQMDTLLARGQWDRALEVYGNYGRLGYEAEPEDKLRLGILQAEAGNDDLAQRLFDEAEAGGVRDSRLYYYRGKILLTAGKTGDAIAALQAAIGIDPDAVGAHITLAKTYAGQKQDAKAMEELRAIEHLEIDDPRLAAEYQELYRELQKRL